MTTNKYKVLYNEGTARKIFKVAAESKQAAYESFRRVFGRIRTVISIIREDDNKKHVIIKERKISAYVIILTVTFLLGMIFGVYLNSRIPHPVDVERYVVESGDTVWGIATLSDGWNNIDPRFIVDDIMRLSDCSATFHPGQVVFIPMYNK